MRDIRLAPARFPQDLESVRAIFAEYGESLGIDLSFQNFAEELRDLPGSYAEPGGVILLARRGEAIVGCGALRPLSDRECEMKRLYVRPAARGSGLGRRLAIGLIEQGRERGYATMRLDTMTSMTAAIQLYEDLGFQRCEPYSPAGRADLLFFERDLTAVE